MSIQRLLAAFALALTVWLGAASAALANGPHGLNNASWLAEIDAAFADVKGYSAVIVHENGYVLQRAGGTAGPGQGMNWDTYGNVGSVHKMVATLMLLRKIEDIKGRGNLLAMNLELDRPAFHFVPAVIAQAVPLVNRQITLRDLIQHKSGLRTEHHSGNPFIDFMQPINPANYGVREYSNSNLKLLGYLTVTYAFPHILAQANNYIAQNGLSANSPQIIQYLGLYYVGMVQNQLLKQAMLPVYGSCWLKEHIIDFMKAPIARMYWNKNDPANSGGWYDGGVAAGHCKGQGGWYYSARGLARLFRDLGTNDGVISAAAYNAMYAPAASAAVRDNRLGWSSQIGSPKLQTVFGWNASPYHGGSHTINFHGNQVTARAAVIRLPGGYHAVALVNSREMTSWDVANALKNAFARSIP